MESGSAGAPALFAGLVAGEATGAQDELVVPRLVPPRELLLVEERPGEHGHQEEDEASVGHGSRDAALGDSDAADGRADGQHDEGGASEAPEVLQLTLVRVSVLARQNLHDRPPQVTNSNN